MCFKIGSYRQYLPVHGKFKRPLTFPKVVSRVDGGIVDKKKLQNLYTTFKNIQNGPKREIIGDESIEEKWTWIDRNDDEDE